MSHFKGSFTPRAARSRKSDRQMYETTTVDGSEFMRSPVVVGSLSPLFYRVFYTLVVFSPDFLVAINSKNRKVAATGDSKDRVLVQKIKTEVRVLETPR